MANVKVTGRAMVITLNTELAALEKVARYNPEALTVKDEKGNALFTVGVGDNPGINKYGATFSDATFGEKKHACITAVINLDDCDDIKGYIADKYGKALEYLNQIDAAIPDVLKSIDARRAKIMEGIEIE